MPTRSNRSTLGGIPLLRRSSPPRALEDRLALDHVVLHPAGHRDDLVDPAYALLVDAQVDDEVDRRGDGGYDEPGRDVLARQQRQRAHLHQRLAGAVGVQRAHAGQPGVEREQQVEALLGPDLAHDDPARPHPQRLLDQVAQPDLAGALEPGLPGLQRHPVGVREPQLPDLLGRHDPVAAGDRRRQAVEQRGLARLGAAGDQDVEPGPHRRLEERRRSRTERAELDQVGEPGGLEHELADVDRAEPAADALEHHVQPVALGQHRVDERLADVDPPTARLQHPLHQLLHLRGAEHQVGQLVPTVAGDEDPARVVDPDLLDRRVVEVGLQRPEPGHPRHQLAHQRSRHRPPARPSRSGCARRGRVRRPRRSGVPTPASRCGSTPSLRTSPRTCRSSSSTSSPSCAARASVGVIAMGGSPENGGVLAVARQPMPDRDPSNRGKHQSVDERQPPVGTGKNCGL